jgi:hypothetical protein
VFLVAGQVGPRAWSLQVPKWRVTVERHGHRLSPQYSTEPDDATWCFTTRVEKRRRPHRVSIEEQPAGPVASNTHPQGDLPDHGHYS